MKIQPLPGIIQIKLEQAQAGVLNTSSRESAVEFAEVLAIDEKCGMIKKGDKLFVKSWGIDTISHKDEKFYFVALETNAILAIVK